MPLSTAMLPIFAAREGMIPCQPMPPIITPGICWIRRGKTLREARQAGHALAGEAHGIEEHPHPAPVGGVADRAREERDRDQAERVVVEHRAETRGDCTEPHNSEGAIRGVGPRTGTPCVASRPMSRAHRISNLAKSLPPSWGCSPRSCCSGTAPWTPPTWRCSARPTWSRPGGHDRLPPPAHPPRLPDLQAGRVHVRGARLDVGPGLGDRLGGRPPQAPRPHRRGGRPAQPPRGPRHRPARPRARARGLAVRHPRPRRGRQLRARPLRGRRHAPHQQAVRRLDAASSSRPAAPADHPPVRCGGAPGSCGAASCASSCSTT